MKSRAPSLACDLPELRSTPRVWWNSSHSKSSLTHTIACWHAQKISFLHAPYYFTFSMWMRKIHEKSFDVSVCVCIFTKTYHLRAQPNSEPLSKIVQKWATNIFSQFSSCWWWRGRETFHQFPHPHQFIHQSIVMTWKKIYLLFLLPLHGDSLSLWMNRPVNYLQTLSLFLGSSFHCEM